MLDVYCISLSASWMSDSTLSGLMSRVPARCILLFEDLDAAFTRSTSRQSGDFDLLGMLTEGPKDQKKPRKKKNAKDTKDSMSDVNTLSLSGLLNALDGIAAAEGRLLFAYVFFDYYFIIGFLTTIN